MGNINETQDASERDHHLDQVLDHCLEEETYDEREETEDERFDREWPAGFGRTTIHDTLYYKLQEEREARAERRIANIPWPDSQVTDCYADSIAAPMEEIDDEETEDERLDREWPAGFGRTTIHDALYYKLQEEREARALAERWNAKFGRAIMPSLDELDPQSNGQTVLPEWQQGCQAIAQRHNRRSGGEGSINAAQGLCAVCRVKEATMAVIKCGHLAMCRGCCNQIIAGTKACPICRAYISGHSVVIRIYKT